MNARDTSKIKTGMDDTLIPSILGLIRILFWIVFAMTLADFIRVRDRTRLEIVLAFGFAALIVTSITTQGKETAIDWKLPASVALALHPYIFLRLASHIKRIPFWVDRITLGGSVVWAIALPLTISDLPSSFIIAFLIFFVSSEVYAGSVFVRGAISAQGVTRWRSLLVAIGSGALGITIVLVGINGLYPEIQPALEPPALILVSISPLAFYMGVAAPRWLRQIWRRAELGRFLSDLPSRSDRDGIARITAYLRNSAIRAVGGLQASVARWDRETQQHLMTPFSAVDAQDDGEVVPELPLDLDRVAMFAVPATRFGPETGMKSGAAVVVLVVPIAIDDWLWGHLLVSMVSAPLFVLDDLELLGLMAGQAARFFRYESLSAQQEALIHVAHRLGTHTDLAELLDEICSQTRSALQVPIAVVDVDGHKVIAPAYSAREDLRTGFKQLMDAFPALSTDGSVLNGSPIRVTGDIRSDPELPNRELYELLDLRTTVVADMVHEGRLLGRLKIVTTGASRLFSEEELALLQGIAAQAALAVRNAQLLAAAQKEIAEREKVEEALRSAHTSLERKVEERTAELREQSIRDPMTGVYNRRYMQEHFDAEMARARAGGSSLGVIMVDVDQFKKFNDTFGHTAGDGLLRWAAEALQTKLRREDMICRFGGDEFILILIGATLDHATRRALEIHSELKEGLGRRGLVVTVSMGVAAYPQTGDGEKDVVTRADDALYHAKQTGKDRVVTETI